MKELELETSNGKFILICQDSFDGCVETFCYINKYKKIGFLRHITEEQASEVVVKYEHQPSYIDELFYRIKSKGVHLFENPYENSTDLNSSFFSMQEDFNKEKEAEEKTFYNPYLFKVI